MLRLRLAEQLFVLRRLHFHCISSAESATLLRRAERMPKTLSKQIFLLWRAVKKIKINIYVCFLFFLLLGFIYSAP